MLLYIIRHGDPDYATDSLTPRGRLQAEAVGKRLVDAKIDRIFPPLWDGPTNGGPCLPPVGTAL